MKLTIIPSDNAVYKDGLCYSPLMWEDTPEDIHALQWFNSTGWIEFKDNNPYDNYKPANETITELPLWALNAIDAWEVANIEATKPQVTEGGI